MRRTTTVKARQASRRNIIRAQTARIGKKEVRSVGRVVRSRQRYSKPASRNPTTMRVARSRTRMVGAL
jgi:hypothetical protein